jgi:hypothetical protein
VETAFVDYYRPPRPNELANIREIFQRVRKAQQAKAGTGRQGGRRNILEAFAKAAKAEGITDKQLAAFNRYRREQRDPKRQLNPQLSEEIRVKVTLAADAGPGTRELRVATPLGLSNPVRFRVGTLAECREGEPNDRMDQATTVRTLPAVLNGQIMPGDVDRFRITARAGQKLVVDVGARELIPYLADAVPGWFQATVALYDPDGRELAYADDFRFDPDPVLVFEVPRDGDYVLEVRDSIYRGREDFVYRVTVGELPFVSGVFPLGARAGGRVTVELDGANLPVKRTALDLSAAAIGVRPLDLPGTELLVRPVVFAVDDLDETTEREPNDGPPRGRTVTLPVVVNGRIDRPDDVDVYRFRAWQGATVVAEVFARRLGSPLDSVIRLTDAAGREVALSDDFTDPGCGLVTHHADSKITAMIRASGDYLLWVADVQQKGGPGYAYRLWLSHGRPDFELRVVPSAVNVRPGMTVPVTVHALRRDGFDGDIALSLVDAPAGFTLDGAWVPAGQDRCTLTLTVPAGTTERLTPLRLEGVATVGRKEVRHEAVPADDTVQAFILHHLVPAESWTVAVAQGRFGRRGGAGWTVNDGKLLKLRPGRSARLRAEVRRWAPLDRMRLELSEPPEGITLESVKPAGRRGLDIVLGVDGDKLKPDLKGNLIFNLFIEWQQRTKEGKPTGNTRRIPTGVLPAVPFEVAGR